jgi:hypothetical protein
MKYAEWQVKAVVELKKQGTTHREIAKTVFGRESYASTVWYILNSYLYNATAVPKQGPKVLVFDLETSPELGYVWGRFKQFLAPVQVKQRSYLLTWSAKWLGEEEVMADAIPNHRPKFYTEFEEEDPYAVERGAYNEEDDFEVVRSIWNLLDECDVAIAHNGLRFDFPYLNSRFVFHGLGMPSPYKAVDTCKIAKKYFRFASNSLKELGIYLGIETPKLDTNFQLWIDCMEGKKEAWDYMLEYNVFDVKLLEEVYYRLRHYDKAAPNLALYYDDDAVRDPVTGSVDVTKLEGKFAYTASSAFPTYRSEGGHTFRSSKAVKRVKNVNSQ